MRPKVPKLKTLIAFACVYILWGSTYLAIRFAIETLPPFLMAGVRFLTAGSILYLFSSWKERIRPDSGHWKSAFKVGGLLLLGGNGLVVWAQQYVPSGITALVIATVPLWTVLLEWLWLRKRRPDLKVFSGIALGMAGLWLLIAPKAQGLAIRPIGVLALLTAALLWSIGSIEARRARLPKSSLLSTGMEMIAGGSLLFLAAVIAGNFKEIHTEAISLKSCLSLGYLIFFGALLGFTAYKYMLKVSSPTMSSTYAYINPVIAVFLGWALAGEVLSMRIILGAVVILAGVFLITLSEARLNLKPSHVAENP